MQSPLYRCPLHPFMDPLPLRGMRRRMECPGVGDLDPLLDVSRPRVAHLGLQYLSKWDGRRVYSSFT